MRRYRRQLGSAPSPTWRSFLRLHAHAIWACDVFTVQTLPVRTRDVVLFISHDRRRSMHGDVPAHPPAPGVWQQVIHATPGHTAPQFRIRDHDRTSGGDFVRRAARLGIRTVLTPVQAPQAPQVPQAPQATAIAERGVRTVRQECRDHGIVLNARHRRRLLREFVPDSTVTRPHRRRKLEPPAGARPVVTPPGARLRAQPVLGGLHHAYEWAYRQIRWNPLIQYLHEIHQRIDACEEKLGGNPLARMRSGSRSLRSRPARRGSARPSRTGHSRERLGESHRRPWDRSARRADSEPEELAAASAGPGRGARPSPGGSRLGPKRHRQPPHGQRDRGPRPRRARAGRRDHALHCTADGYARRSDGRKHTFDYMLANPPFGVEWKQQERAIKQERDTLGHEGRFGAGLPRINDGSLLFLQHMLSKMQPAEKGGSRIAIVFNGSPLFTGDAGSGESEIRRWIIENDWLEATAALPNQLFYNTGISTYIWVLTNRKEPRRQGKVQLIDGRRFFVKMRKSLGNKRKSYRRSRSTT